MRIDPTTMQIPTNTIFPLELAYALMREAEAQEPGEEGRFRAMDCHCDIMVLADGNRSVRDALYSLGMAERIGTNQERLGI